MSFYVMLGTRKQSKNHIKTSCIKLLDFCNQIVGLLAIVENVGISMICDMYVKIFLSMSIINSTHPLTMPATRILFSVHCSHHMYIVVVCIVLSSSKVECLKMQAHGL